MHVGIKALIKRVNRKLAIEGMKLKASRGIYFRSSLGDYYLVKVPSNFMVEIKVDVEALARKLGVMSDWESADPH